MFTVYLLLLSLLELSLVKDLFTARIMLKSIATITITSEME